MAKTITPFINKDLLRQALTAVGCNHSVQGNTIVTERKDYYGNQKFEFINGRYTYVHESNAGTSYGWRSNVDISVRDFLTRVENEYNAISRRQQEELERKRLEAERLRLEAERRQEEAERKRLEAEKQRAEAERKRLEAEKRKAEAEKKRLEEERRRAEEEQRRQEEEVRRAEEEKRRLEEERRLAEEELRRLEEERRTYVEKQRQTIIANAKSQGYDVREEHVENKIKLVLVRTTY
jgi:flagellar biosynthesis GTPase FlhF